MENTAMDLLFETGLRHLYHAEKAILKNLGKLAEEAGNSELAHLFLTHRNETEGQLERLEKIFQILQLDVKANRLGGVKGLADQAKELFKSLLDLNLTNRSKGLEGLVSEGTETIRHFAKTDVGELALTGIAHQVEAFEEAAYRFLIRLAKRYDKQEIVEMLNQNLEQEQNMEKRLTDFADQKAEELMRQQQSKAA